VNSKKGLTLTAALATLGTPFAVQAADDGSLELYGSFRMGQEYVDPDNNNVDSYTGLRDAYTRLGVSASKEVHPGYTALLTYELGIDSTTGEISTLNFDGAGRYGNKQSRVSKIGMSTPYGTVHAGKMWGVFYNAIAYPVDMYSSYYAGWSTYALFRTSDTIAYASPNFGGFSFNLGVSQAKGEESDGATFGKYNENDPSTGGGNVYTATATYSGGPFTASLGYEQRTSEEDDTGSADNLNDFEAGLAGAAVSYKQGNLHLAAQYEWVADGIEVASGNGGYYVDADGNRSDFYPGGKAYLEEDAQVYNLYAAYTLGNTTLKAKGGKAEGVTGTFMHLGVDQQVADNLKLFAEYYQDEGGGFSPIGYDDPGAEEGGNVFTVGAHLSFSSQVM
jgi:hypothetical protein